MVNEQIQNLFSGEGRFCATEEDTRRAGREAGLAVCAPIRLSLEGPLGAGKTCFVKGLAEGLGCPPEDVSSPTFTLIHEYHEGRFPLVHMDLYRLESAEELPELGFDDYLAGTSVVAIEWGDKFSQSLSPDMIRLEFSIEETGRRIRLKP